MKERLRTQLKLTPEQFVKISPIIDKTAVQLKRMRRDTAWRAHEVIVGAHREMAANLTDEQDVGVLPQHAPQRLTKGESDERSPSAEQNSSWSRSSLRRRQRSTR